MLLSGGVDSSLALQLLCAAGHAPTAFYLQIWFQEDFANFWDSCPWEEDLQYCREVSDGGAGEAPLPPLWGSGAGTTGAPCVSQLQLSASAIEAS